MENDRKQNRESEKVTFVVFLIPTFPLIKQFLLLQQSLNMRTRAARSTSRDLESTKLLNIVWSSMQMEICLWASQFILTEVLWLSLVSGYYIDWGVVMELNFCLLAEWKPLCQHTVAVKTGREGWDDKWVEDRNRSIKRWTSEHKRNMQTQIHSEVSEEQERQRKKQSGDGRWEWQQWKPLISGF